MRPESQDDLPPSQDAPESAVASAGESSPELESPASALELPNVGRSRGKWEPPTLEELQAALPQYEILGLLGRGGMGAVYKGRHKNLDRLVAVKILPPDLGDDGQNYAERFKNEARAMARLAHPGIVAVHDFGQTAGGLLYFVMECIEGTDVGQMVARQGRLPHAHALAITAHVCDALQYAHDHGIIHRDIKPSNIMVGYDGAVKVADFGLAKITREGETGITHSSMAMGTLHYMAPEALTLGVEVDHRADVYAMGVMLYQMLTGKLPQGLFEMPSARIRELDPRYDGIVAKALREDRSVRYQSARELRHDLDAILTTPVIKERPAENEPPAAQAPRKLVQGPADHSMVARRRLEREAVALPPRRSSWGAWLVIGCLMVVLGGFFLMKQFRLGDAIEGSASETAASPNSASSQRQAATVYPAPKPISVLPADLLANVALPRDVVRGQWVKMPAGLSTERGIDANVLEFNCSPPEEYDYAVEFTAVDTDPDVSLLLAVPSHCFAARFTHEHVVLGSNLDGLRDKDPARTEAITKQFTLKEGRHQAVAEVRCGAVRVLLDGQEALKWSGDFKRLAVSSVFGLRDKSHLGIAARQSSVAFHSARVLPPGSHVAEAPKTQSLASEPPPSLPAQWIDALALVDPAKHSLRPETVEWKRVAAGFESARVDHTNHVYGGSLRLPVALAPSYAIEAEFTAARPDSNIGIKVPAGSAITTCWICGGKRFAGIAKIDTKDPWEHTADSGWSAPFVLTPGHRYLAHVEVRRALGGEVDIQFLLDGQWVGAYRGPPNRLSVSSCWPKNGDPKLAEIATLDAITVHAARVKAIADIDPAARAKADERLAKLEVDFAARLAAEVMKPYRDAETALKNSYIVNGLTRARADALAKRKTADIVAIDAEKTRMAGGGDVPNVDEANTPAALAALRKTYRDTVAKYAADRDGKSAPLFDAHLRALDDYAAELITSCSLDAARQVKAARDAASIRKILPDGFANSLGMKFVPVPGTQILMCIHETRNKDYEAYAAANPGIDLSWRGARDHGVFVSESEDCPVPRMNWEQARGFCDWLSKKEGVTYRLPTDHEWSCAAGIGDRELAGGSPQSLAGKIDEFAWGRQWPPPAGSGNFADPALLGRLPGTQGIEGYTDGFGMTSPVMSFAPNTLGIYDLSGNLWEWCEDWYDSEQKDRLLRGGSFMSSRRDDFALSARRAYDPGDRYYDFGFRCVVELASLKSSLAAAAASTTPPSTTSTTSGTNAPAVGTAPTQPAAKSPPPSGASTWIDDAGRKIQARFKALERDTLVVILGNGTAWRVPMSKLSPESQELARDYERQGDPPTATATAGAATAYPFASRINSVSWDGQQYQPVYQGELRTQDKTVGSLKGKPVDGLAFHPDGRIAFAGGSGTTPNMIMAYWGRSGNHVPIVDLKYKPSTSDPAVRAAEEAVGIFWFFSGHLAFDPTGTCFFTLGSGSDGIYKVLSNSPVKIERLRPDGGIGSMQIPFFDPKSIYVTKRSKIFRIHQGPATASSGGVPWFEFAGKDISLAHTLVISPTLIITVLSIRPDGEGTDTIRNTVLFERVSKGYWFVPSIGYGPMAISWDGKKLIRYYQNQIIEFSFPQSAGIPGLVSGLLPVSGVPTGPPATITPVK